MILLALFHQLAEGLRFFFRRLPAEPLANVDHRYDSAAQIDHAADVRLTIRNSRQV